MTPAQLAIARQYQAWHAERFGYATSNVHFIDGELERLGELGIADSSVDVIVSNCVINLCTDKAAVLRAAWQLLTSGGELYFSDVYADRRVPAALQADPVLYGECLSGALYWNDFLHLARACGFADPRLVESRPLTIDNPALEEKTAPIRFYSATYRLFKLDGLEPACEDYGQAVVYRGTVAHHPVAFALDQHHVMEAGRVFPVCGNSWRMLHDTRFKPHFDFIGDFSRHYGIFEGCGSELPFDAGGASTASGNGCC
jgi:SAM-dependent methyltransferase